MSQLPELNPHHDLIEQRLPAWSRHATPEHWYALLEQHAPAQGLPGQEADWFANAAPDLRAAVLQAQAVLQRSQQRLARSLSGLKQIRAFAEPLLAQHLLERHGLQAPLQDCELLWVRQSWHWQTGRWLKQHERQSLLQAALQNFADDVSFADDSAVARRADIDVIPIVVRGSILVSPDLPAADIDLPSEAYRVTALPLTPAAFAQGCRELDLGRQYQAHLREVFEAPDTGPDVRRQALAVHRARLRVAAELAYLRHRIGGRARDALLELIEGGSQRCWQLSLFDIRLHEATLIQVDAVLLLYLPGSEVELRQFDSWQAVLQALRDDVRQATRRQAMLAHVALEQRADFNRILLQNLDGDLHVQRLPLGPTLFEHWQDDHLARLQHEARLLAVPTADADEQARRRRLAGWRDLGLDVLTLAGFFVPSVGSLMLAVTAFQLLDEVCEGHAAWSVGDRDMALRHFAAVGLNLALLGGLHLAGKVVPRLFNSQLMESLEEVRLSDDSQRLWRPELASYRSDMRLPADLQATPQGQYRYQDKTYIRMDGHLYEQRLDPRSGQWCIVHPSEPRAYQPALEHNGQGAWRAEHEQPLDWNLTQLVSRLGGTFAQTPATDVQLAEKISGIGRASLRRVHLRGEPPAPLLLDTLERLAAARQAQARVAQAAGEDFTGAFSQAYQDGMPTDEAVRRLCQDYPRLSAPLARRLLLPLTPTQRMAWQAHGVLPTFLVQQVARVHEALPLVRALEGLHQPLLANPCSERLVFAGLERLTVWPDDLRLELRADSPQGATLASAGPRHASQLRIVLRTPRGYEPDLGERPAAAATDKDLCQAVLRALPAAQREAWRAGGADELRAQLQAQAERAREAWAWRLGRPSMPRPRGLLRGGGPTDYPLIASPRGSLRARYQRLFPAASDLEFQQDLARWQRELRTAEVELRHLEQRLRQLRETLAQWAAESDRRQRMTQAIINAWRRDDTINMFDGQPVPALTLEGLDVQDQDLASLPLPPEFTHVRALNLRLNSQLTQLPAAFLGRFPALEYLHLDRCRFAQLPVIDNPAGLFWLDLQGNRITWDAAAQASLERFTHLRVLDLSDNPLLVAPDLGALSQLHSVHLSGCSLSQLPRGLATLREPLVLDLGENQFQQLPADLHLPEQTGQALRLESPWLSPQVHEQIHDYHAQHGVDLLVAHMDYEELLEYATASDWPAWTSLPLQYRRDLRALLDTERFLDHPEQAHRELWLRLRRMHADPDFRALALARPALLLPELDP